MYLKHVQAYTAPEEYHFQKIGRAYGKRRAKAMPPVKVAFLNETYSGGYPIYRIGNRWEMVTTLQHIRMDVRGPLEMRLRAWGRYQDRKLFEPAIDRVIKCQEG